MCFDEYVGSEDRIWQRKKQKLKVKPRLHRTEHKKIWVVSSFQQVFNPLNEDVLCKKRHPAVQSPNSQAYLWFRHSQSTSQKADDVSLHLCVSARKGEDDWSSYSLGGHHVSFHQLDAQRGLSSLFPPWRSLSLEQHGRHVQIPKHSSIKTFWLLTRPQKMVDMCCLWGARRRFSPVTLSLCLKWEITLRNWLADALRDSLSCVHPKETNLTIDC